MDLAGKLSHLQGGKDAELEARLQAAAASLASPQFSQLKFFRITSDTPTTTSTTTTSSTTSTTSTTTTSTSTTTPAPCFSRVWRGIPCDVQFDDSRSGIPGAGGYDVYGYRALVVIERLENPASLYAPNSLALQLNDIVLAAQINGNWFVLARYGNCPRANVTTTTTTTTTSTSTTTPPPKPR